MFSIYKIQLLKKGREKLIKGTIHIILLIGVIRKRLSAIFTGRKGEYLAYSHEW